MRLYSQYIFLFFFNLVPNIIGAKWRTYDHKIFKNDQEFLLKSVNWHGYENGCGIANGLWMHPMTWYLDFIRGNNFNTLRIPFSYETALKLDNRPICMIHDNFYSVRDSIKFLFQESDKRGIHIILDFHTINNEINQYPLANLNTDQFNKAWDNMLDIALNYDNFMGIDIKNEPHNPTDLLEWAVIANNFIKNTKQTYPQYDGLFLIEGTQGIDGTGVWGGSFYGIEFTELQVDDRIVFSPHVYGPSVIGVSANEFGDEYFYKHFGFLRERYNSSIIFGETGGYMSESDGDMQFFKRLKLYLEKIDQRSVCWWALCPNSFDTGGLLENDWTTPVAIKLNWLQDLVPNPTFPKKRYLRYDK